MPKLDVFFLKNGDEDLFKMDVAAGRGRVERGGQFGIRSETHHLISSHLTLSHFIFSRQLANEPKQKLHDQRVQAARFCWCSWAGGCVSE